MEGNGTKAHKVFYMRQGKNQGDAIWKNWKVVDNPVSIGDRYINKKFKDPFTHCYDKEAAYPPHPTQMISTILQWAGNQSISDFEDRARVVTGMYGHNSNTDADAELYQFESCGKNPTTKPESACDKCGNPRGKNVQWPCLDRTNKAEAKWHITDGMHNVDDSKLGSLPGKAPKCANTQYKVRGM